MENVDLYLLSLFPQKGARIRGGKERKLDQRGQQWGEELARNRWTQGGRRPPFIDTRESNHWMPSNHGTTALARPGSQCHRGGTHTTTQEKPELPQLLQMNSDSGKLKLDRKLTNKAP